jgi:hypothetical protein
MWQIIRVDRASTICAGMLENGADSVEHGIERARLPAKRDRRHTLGAFVDVSPDHPSHAMLSAQVRDAHLKANGHVLSHDLFRPLLQNKQEIQHRIPLRDQLPDPGMRKIFVCRP